MSCIVLIGGIPGSGKTEFISFLYNNQKEIFKSLINQNGLLQEECHDSVLPDIHVIAFDELCSVEDQAEISKTLNGWRNFRVQILGGAERYICDACTIECLVQGPLTLRSEELLSKLKSRNSNSPNKVGANKCNLFLVEDNFYYRSMRYEWFQIARRGNIGFCQIFITCPLNLALQRNQVRDHNIPERLIKIMYSSLELPDPEKNRWENFSLLFENRDVLNCSKMLGVVKLIQKAINKPAEMVINEKKFEAQNICSKNVIHQADKILRKLTGKIIQDNVGHKNPDIPGYSVPQIIKVRQKLLSQIKQNELKLPSELVENIQNFGINAEDVYTAFETVLWKSLRQELEAFHT